MKIAIFSGEIPSSTFIESLIKGIAKEHRVLLFGVVKERIDYNNPNIKIIKTPFSTIKNLYYNFFRSLRLLIKSPSEFKMLLKEISKYKDGYERRIWFSKFLPIILYKPDILHLQWARDVEFYTFLRAFDIKLIVSLRGAHINYTPIVDKRAEKHYKLCFPKIDAFHAVSSAMADAALAYNAEADKISVIYSPISKEVLDLFQPKPEKKDAPLKLLSIGRFHWVKGLSYAIDACKILSDNDVDFHYTIVSTNPVSEDALFQMHQLDLTNHIDIAYNLPQSELFSLMKDYDALILPSINEGIANVVIEAMAMGLPVISTDCGGMPEIIIHRKTGWLVPTRNPNAIADAVMEFSKLSNESINSMTLNAHKLVKDKFDYDTSIQKFKTLYKETLGR